MSISFEPTIETRSAALHEVLERAKEIGVMAALQLHDAHLTPEDRQLISDLAPHEVDELLALSGQMSDLDAIAMDTNNNL